MAGIIGAFRVLWIYYGLLIVSRPVIAWNLVGVMINSLTVWAYLRFAASTPIEPVGERRLDG